MENISYAEKMHIIFIHCKNHLRCILNCIKRLNELKLLGDVYSEEKYVLGVNLKSRQIHITLRNDSDIYEHIQAAFQAEVINVLAQMYADDKNSTARPPASIVNGNY